MGVAAIEKWFPPTVRDLMFIQDVDGGLKAPDHITCQKVDGWWCTPGVPDDLCAMQRSFCARERVFCTAAALAVLVADTPYRKGFLDPASVK
jgi:hypothetical protein